MGTRERKYKGDRELQGETERKNRRLCINQTW